MTLSINGRLHIALCLALIPGCSDSQPVNAGAGGVSSSAGSSATAGTLGGGAAGTESLAGSAGRVAANGGSGGASAAGSPGAAGLGGASSATSGGGSSLAGASGTSGTFGAGGSFGTSGTGGSSGGAGLLVIASAFDQFRFECPCIDANHFGPTKGENCDNAATADRQTHPKRLGGDASIVYDIKLRVRGNTEPHTYVKGKLDPNKRFYVGGETSTPGYTAYMLTVADPQQVYFFNYNPSTSHSHFLLDYEVTIPMRGGTMLTFEVNGGKSAPDGHGVSNHDQVVVPGISPAPDPYNGQLVQFDVVSVTQRP